MKLEELLAQADKMMEAVEPITVPVKLNGGQHLGVRFLPMSGADWRTLTARHAPRDGAEKDAARGYNIAGVVAAYPDVVVITDDAEPDSLLREDSLGHTYSIWPDVASRLTAKSLEALEFQMWAAHEYTPELVEQAGKA
ncbi:MAG: hypothetical protein BGN97_03735 [Microbacterium sp. 69-10]|uniref:hypothetical protein n=1 Tax=Microbacterium sp. 69-10 TaxID=1895783 RepID=UPI000964DE4D|nr:hypothetical protein [Microbacterium sp. 69-10]OJU41822.1 MAG: hypothetical protein BGN97_03735 [Microbacterium sp. 69-10]